MCDKLIEKKMSSSITILHSDVYFDMWETINFSETKTESTVSRSKQDRFTNCYFYSNVECRTRTFSKNF